jgi:gluconokinase
LQSKMVLALDIGTSSTRAMLFDERAQPVPGIEKKIEYDRRTTPDGGDEYDVDVMLACAEQAIDDALAQAGELANQIAAVASDSLVSNVLGVDEAGRAVTPVFTYADTRNAREVNELRARYDEEANHQRVGTLFHSSYLPARFNWLARTRADEFRRVRYWMSLGEYFLFKWTGQRACSYSVASWTGLLNRRELAWDKELFATLPVRADQFSPLVDHSTHVGNLKPEYAARWRALANAKFFPTIGDGAAVNVGSGCVDASRIALTIGTTSAMRVVKPCEGSEPSQGFAMVPRGLWAYRVTGKHELIGGALSEGGALFNWMVEKTLNLDRPSIERELAAMQPDAHGLTMLPFLAGERAPNWNADARGAMVGLSLDTKPIEILRAGLESIAYRLGLIFSLLRGVAPDASQVIASGGALMNSPTWIQIIADVLGAPVTASAENEATSRGTALLALKGLGVINSLTDLPATLGATFQPDASRHEIYARAMERQNWLYNAVVK